MTVTGTINAAVDALRHQPMMLFVIVLNVIIIGAIFYTNRESQQADHALISKLYEQHAELSKLLYNCTPTK